MACINPDGSVSKMAVALLRKLDKPLTAEEISKEVGQPLFIVRSSLREMVSGGLIELSGNQYIRTEKGKEKI